jgi:hypothetical protein
MPIVDDRATSATRRTVSSAAPSVCRISSPAVTNRSRSSDEAVTSVAMIYNIDYNDCYGLLRKLGVTNRFDAATGIRAGISPERMSTKNIQPRTEPAMKRMIVAIALLILTPAAPAAAAPNPSPVAPAHTGTACANVLAKNPQAGPDSRSAPPAQENFFAVGAVFCGIS